MGSTRTGLNLEYISRTKFCGLGLGLEDPWPWPWPRPCCPRTHPCLFRTANSCQIAPFKQQQLIAYTLNTHRPKHTICQLAKIQGFNVLMGKNHRLSPESWAPVCHEFEASRLEYLDDSLLLSRVPANFSFAARGFIEILEQEQFKTVLGKK